MGWRVVSARRARAESDEAYVLDLCDAILGEPASRQHRFDWLVGDPGRPNDSDRPEGPSQINDIAGARFVPQSDARIVARMRLAA